MEVAIRDLRGTRQASDVVQQCPFEQAQDTTTPDTTTPDIVIPEPEEDVQESDESGSGGDVVTLTNGYRVAFLGVSYGSDTSTWRYQVEELPVAQDLSNWVLELPSCARVVSASPDGEAVNPDPNAQLNGMKWQPGGGFVNGVFSVTLSGNVTVGRTTVAVKGPDVALGALAGPVCGLSADEL
jgi:hypothetical protein